VVLRPGDTYDQIMHKVVVATILGTLQSACTNFPWLSGKWKQNCEEERLLGVSFTGIMDHAVMCGTGKLQRRLLQTWLPAFRKKAHETNRKYAELIGISPSKAITCVKPSGTTSCLAGTASGLHPRYAKHYIRRVRADIKDPVCQLMIDQGIPHEPCVLRPESTMVFSFPQKAPYNSICSNALTARDHLDIWLMYQLYWCDHKPSITVTYRDDDFLLVGSWVYNNWDNVSGISFLPFNGMIYDQAPFEKINLSEYQDLVKRFPKSVDWSKLSEFEKEDCTVNQKTLACTANACELVDLEAV